MENIGTKIRIERRKVGLSLERLAQKVGISPMTLHRIETDKSSPSLVLLTEIAHQLSKDVVSFLQELEDQKLPIHIKRKEQLSISSSALNIKVIGPRKMIGENVVVTTGEIRKGKSVNLHTDTGKEFSYIIEGRCEFRQNNQTIFLEKGDSIFHNARLKHSLSAIEKLRFFSIFFKEGD